ncbi:TPA: hypothetical protein QHR34_004098 [Raoultella ornithinolytica]|nr:hypothetical protein [Raoultella ornithinolytica]HDT1249927.1 hypothetical protein [Raoultella ornithinolytica]
MNVLFKIIGQVFLSVLIKMILTIFSKKVIGTIMFACLHRLVKITKTQVDDEYISKLEKMYWDINDTTDVDAQNVLDKINESKDKK